MRRKYKVPLGFILFLIILVIGLIVLGFFKKDEKQTEPVKVLDSINNYNYSLHEKDTNLKKENYNELKKVLKEKEVDYEKYADLLARLFVIDLFTLNNKINKYDIRCSEYVYPDVRENFKLNVTDTLYKIIEDNTDKKRMQKLPEVSSITSEVSEQTEFKYQEISLEAYIISLTWEYKEDLGYDNKAKVTIVKKDNNLFVAEYKVGDKND